ncbi:MAG: FAD-binding oxidoreductase [Spirochaetes bacterium]|nr:FAD-binding oxidoreductase [Spirochaetota bacterium]
MSEHRPTSPWTVEPPLPGSYRAIAKLGKPDDIKLPSDRYVSLLKRELGLEDAFFAKPPQDGNKPVRIDGGNALGKDVIRAVAAIVGEENVQCDAYNRIKYSHGKIQEEIFNLKRGIIHEITGAAVHPRHAEDVGRIVALCSRRKIPVYAYGGGSSVNKGFLPERAGITLVLGTHMNRVLEINERNHTCRVQAGCMGPDLERALNGAPELFGTTLRFTCGHFPQSFELSSVGGWVLTLGSGQASTYYGDAANLVLSMEAVTPTGIIRTSDYPSTATGPRVMDMMKGSEGAFGILTELTIRIFRYMPENRKYFGFLFPDWCSAVGATREISQGEFGLPAVLRISDAEETDHAFQMYPVPSAVEFILKARGCRPGRRCLSVGTVEGDLDFATLVRKKVRRIARHFGGVNVTGRAAREWEKDRYRSFLIAEAMTDYDILLDTVETPVRWDNIHEIHEKVHRFADSVPGTMCISHASHFYPSGTNLYFIFGIRGGVKEYTAFRNGLIDAMVQAGGSPSHHHGVGRLMAPWIERFLGSTEMEAIRSIKRHFDPDNIMNPGHPFGPATQKKGKGQRR